MNDKKPMGRNQKKGFWRIMGRFCVVRRPGDISAGPVLRRLVISLVAVLLVLVAVFNAMMAANNRLMTFETAAGLVLLAVLFGSLLILILRADADIRARQTELRNNEAFLRITINSITHPFAVINADTYIIEMANDAYGGAGVIGRQCYFVSHQQNVPCTGIKHPCPLIEVKKTGRPAMMEHIHFNQQGRECHLEIYAHPIFDQNGRLARIIEHTIDVTERLRISKALKENELFLGSLLDSIPAPVFYKDINGRYLGFNHAFENFFGQTRQEMIGKSVFDIAPPDLAGVYHQKDVELFERRGTQIYESQVKNANGEMRDVVFHKASLTDGSGAVSGLVGVILDVTERKEVDAALRAQEARIRAITASAQDAILMMNPRGEISFWNPSATVMFGYTEYEAMGQNLHQLIAPLRYHASHQEALSIFFKTGRGDVVGKTLELEALGKDGREFPVELSLSALELPDGWHAVGIMRDITDRKRSDAAFQETNRKLKAAIVEAERANAAKSLFLANMSHEIRTPMNGVIGMTGLLLETGLNDEQRRYAESVRSSGEVLLTLLNDILDFSKIEAQKLDLEVLDFDLISLMDDFAATLALRAQQKGLEFLYAVEPEVPSLMSGDPGRLRQVLTNIADNAVKFTFSGEVVIRALMQAETPEDFLVRFEVRDTGIGIPEDKYDILFEKFMQVDASTTRQYGGTGLGLAISKQLVEMMGGQIGVESKPGEGSAFWFTVRLGRPAGTVKTESLPPADLAGVRGLIVDDNSTSREILSTRMALWGMRPYEAASGPEALQALLQAILENDPFRIAVIDMHMPDMDGETLGRSILADKRLANTRMVMLTSLGTRGDARRFAEIGFNAYITKPVRHQELKDILSLTLMSPEERALMPQSIVTRHTARETRYRLACKSARILVAEDNITNQQVAVGILKKLGLHADAVADGREAVKALENIPYDLVLMDVQMPVMNGLEAVKEIRDPCSAVGNHDIPVIAMTALALQGDREDCLKAGMNDYVSKPLMLKDLAETLEKWLPPEREECTRTWEKKEAEKTAKLQSTPPCVWDRSGMMIRLANDAKLARMVIDTFLDDIPDQMAKLRGYIETGDVLRAEHQAHSIRGAAANVGGEAFGATAFEIENAAVAGNLESAKDRMAELEIEFKRLQTSMEATGWINIATPLN